MYYILRSNNYCCILIHAKEIKIVNYDAAVDHLPWNENHLVAEK